jgi:predicted phage terminase large subunit-like protein
MPKTLDRALQFVGITTQGALLDSFATFARRAWKEIEPKEMQWSWHHQLICEHLQLCYERRTKRLIICIPPRATKSKLISVLFACWCWAKDPSLSFIFTSYSDSLSTEFSIARRALLQSPWFQQTFPNKVLFAADQNQKTQYQNTAFGQMIATSMTGTVAGKGGDFVIVDDALSPEQSYSDPEREAANRAFDNTFRSRLNEPERGVIINVQQRLHQQDLCGHLQETEPGIWTELVLPMVCEVDTEIRFPISGKKMLRRAGDLLQPERFGPQWVEREKLIGSYRWNSQYQQHPAPPGGAIFRTSWFQRYELLPHKQDHCIISLDTAYSVKKSADYSVASVWIANETGFYLAFVYRDRIEYPQLKQATENLAAFWHPSCILIEAKGSGESLLQSLKQESSLPVIGVKPDVDKISRAHAVTALFESGRVHLPKFAPWLADYEQELELFPYGANDDMVDSTTQALTYLREQMYSDVYGALDFAKSGRALEIRREGLVTQAMMWVKDLVTGKMIANPRGMNLDKKNNYELERRLRGLDAEKINPTDPGIWVTAPLGSCTNPATMDEWDRTRCVGKMCPVSGGLRCNQCGFMDITGVPAVTYAAFQGFVERPHPGK